MVWETTSLWFCETKAGVFGGMSISLLVVRGKGRKVSL